MFPWSLQPQIIQAAIKDNQIVMDQHEECRDIVSLLFKHRSQKYNQEQDFIISSQYYGLTTGFSKYRNTKKSNNTFCIDKILENDSISINSCSLGQEYCEIVPIKECSKPISIQRFYHHNLQNIPLTYIKEPIKIEDEILTKIQRVSIIDSRTRIYLYIYEILLPYILQRITTLPINNILRIYNNHPIVKYILRYLRNMIDYIQKSMNMQNIINTFHLAIFFLYGIYYKISYRIVGIKYISILRRPPLVTYTIQGWMLLIRLFVSFIRYIRLLRKNQQERTERLHRRRRRIIQSYWRNKQSSSPSLQDRNEMVQSCREQYQILQDTEYGDLDIDSGIEDDIDNGNIINSDIQMESALSDTVISSPSYGITDLQDIWDTLPDNISDEEQEAQPSKKSIDLEIKKSKKSYNSNNDTNSIETTINNDRRPCVECPLCFCEACNATVTTCGHIFCWICIGQALVARSQCPLCRTPCEPHEVVRLFQYR